MNRVRLGKLTHGSSRDIRSKLVQLPLSMSDESETEEWWFDVRPKGMQKRRPRAIDELFSERSESSTTFDATTARWHEAFETRVGASQPLRKSRRAIGGGRCVVRSIQASCRPEDTCVFKAHVPPSGACDNLMVALRRSANLQEKKFMKVVDEGMKVGSWRKVVAALRQSQGVVLCQDVGSAPCGDGVGWPNIQLGGFQKMLPFRKSQKSSP